MTTKPDAILAKLQARRLDPGRRIDMRSLLMPPLFAPASEDVVRAAESRLSCAFPAMLRRVYLEVGNGGFGPGAGQLGLDGGNRDDDGLSLVERWDRERRGWSGWPRGVLPLWDWGCGSWSCVDASDCDARIVTVDEFGGTRTAFDLLRWLDSWSDGVDLFCQIYPLETAMMLDPFTKKPRQIPRLGRAIGEKLFEFPAAR